MQSTFELKDSITLMAEGECLDLHNCFDFVGYEYRPTDQWMRLQWRRGNREGVPHELPGGLILTYTEVTNVAVRRRDDKVPFTEDDCLSSISFLPAALNDFYDAICFGERYPDEHMSLKFQSGASLKIWSGKVEHELLPV